MVDWVNFNLPIATFLKVSYNKLCKNKIHFFYRWGGIVFGQRHCAIAGVLLKNQGYNVTIQKFDLYLNLDPGTMSPYQHGEVFVTDDGCETDLDLGHYERSIDKI